MSFAYKVSRLFALIALLDWGILVIIPFCLWLGLSGKFDYSSVWLLFSLFCLIVARIVLFVARVVTSGQRQA